ncbi:MAG: hypothetical protein EOP84_03200 [Verrucomicrobiaceae bacterium]|nr:MAG: hypothetical protein EOP84_03200 [Verrucomicrobiaceae bacterium]
MRLLPRPLHGIFDYLVGLLFIMSPWLFGYKNSQPVAADMAMIFGGAMVIYTALTNFEAGIVRLIPFPAHLILDVVVGVALTASPIIFGIRGIAAVVFVAVGLFELAAASMTRGEGRPSGRPGFPTWS